MQRKLHARRRLKGQRPRNTRRCIDLGGFRLIIDDLDSRREAANRGIPVIGTLGILAEAAHRNLLDLPQALSALQATNFHVDPELLRLLLANDALRRKSLPATDCRLASKQGRDSERLFQEAVERMVNDDEWFLAEVEKGLTHIEILEQ